MSDSSSDSRNSGSGRQRRSGGQRRRSGGNRNRNRNNNRDGDGGGGGRGQRGRQSGGGRRSGGGNRSGGPRRAPKPAPLTFWQKILKAIGLYDPDKPKKRTSPSRVPKPPEPKGKGKGKGRAKSSSRDTRAEQVPVENNRLYVGNLSYDATEFDLEDLFKGIGTVKNVEIVYNTNTHRSKGFGFITMNTVEEAQRAVDTLHDQSFMDRQMIVSGSKSTGPANPVTAPPQEESFNLSDQAEAAPKTPAEEPVAEEPVAEEPVAEEPAVEEPVAEADNDTDDDDDNR